MVPGRARVGVRVLGTAVDGSHPVDPDQYERDPATGQPLAVQAADHDVSVVMAEATLSAELVLGPRVAVETVLPLRWVRADATFLDDRGRVLGGYESIHHRDETLFGPADLELWSRFRLVAPDAGSRWTLDVRAGHTFPTGGTEENPFELGRQGRSHQHVFFGNGTVDALGGVDVARALDGFTLRTWVRGRASLGDNRQGYHAGARLAAGLYAESPFGTRNLRFLAGPEVFREEPATWNDGRERAKNSGRTDVIAAVGASWAPGRATSLDVTLKKPFTVASEGGQVSIPVVALVGFSGSFDLWSEDGDPHEDDHDHDHGHGGHGDDHHDHGGPHPDGHGVARAGDVRDLATGGESFDLRGALVPGNVTVVDFWATWCHPCEHIDADLRVLASKHADLSVRRVEIVDDASPAAREHLAVPVTLPVVWVFDRKGKRVANLVGTSENAVRRAVADALRAE